MSIRDARRLIKHLLDDSSIIDAPTAYYALNHPAQRSHLVTRTNRAGRPRGFAGTFQTGYDLFRPMVTMRAPNPVIAADMLAELLTPGRPYLFFANLSQLPFLGDSFRIESQRILHIYYLDSKRFRPKINVMVVEKSAPDGQPRFEIHHGGLQAISGVNWVSPGFAEVYVATEPEARQRGWGRSVTAACTEHVLRSGRLPLYLVESTNEESIRLAESVGYVDSGARQVFAECAYLGQHNEAGVDLRESDEATSSPGLTGDQTL